MKRPKTKGGKHRAQSPARASNTAITAALILTIILLCALVVWAICASHKLGGSVNEAHPQLPSQASAPASPLGGGPRQSTNGHGKTAVVTTLPTEPLVGGDSRSPGQGGSSTPTRVDTTAPQQRARPAIEAMQVEVVEAKAARERRIAVWRIDTYLAHKNSPMQGCGEYYIQNQERTGIPGALSAGIAEAESTNGTRCYNGAWSHNAWGMIGPEYRGGFASWEEGIRANFDFLVKHFGCPQTMYDCPGYCEGNGTMTTVDQVQWQINAYEPPEGT